MYVASNRTFLTMGYFKDLPRIRLTEREKKETIDAVNRATEYLMAQYHTYELPEMEYINKFTRGFTYNRNVMPYLSRAITLSKGGSQHRSFSSQRRKFQIIGESIKIAEETGADRERVEELFNQIMCGFLRL